LKISFRQIGGFAGLSLGCELDTTSMTRADAAALTRLVRDSKLPESPAREANAAARDLATYEITVEDESGTVTTSFDDMSVPARAQPLMDFLRSRARPRPFK